MTAALELEGILPALITPFTPDGADVDTAALAALVERCIAAGVGGLVPTGSTGEFPTLSPAERRTVAETVLEAAAGRVPTVVGTGALATAEAIALSVHAEQCGAAAVMIVPPFYEAPTWRELRAHYAAVADAISIPIMYYNIPGATGTTLTVEQLAELRRVANVTSFKDTSGDAVAGTEAYQLAGDVPVVLNGWDTLTFAALAAGVRAVVWGSASFMPAECVRLHRLLIEDLDLAGARELWARLWPICRLLETTSYTPAVKAACALVGLDTGPVRAPLLALEPDEHAELGRRLQAAGVTGAEVAG
jgi:4-hydroxy-tetrahydrodipicolinate synthase